MANIFDVIGLLLALSVLAAVTQHVNHLNQLAYMLISHSPGGTVKPDLQFNPIVPTTLTMITIGIVMRKKLSTTMLIAIIILASALFVSILGIHMSHPGVSKF